MSEYSNKLNIIANNTNQYLKKFFLRQNKKSHLTKPIKYGLFSGGKRFRSAIVVNIGKIFGINYKELIVVGSAIECIHAYSLMHDDLPAMDNDMFRRGKLSTHKKFNEFTAILAGNALLTLAFEILSGPDLKTNQKIKNELINSLCNCSGHYGLAEGQYFDLSYEKKKTSMKNKNNIQKKKTGKLFGFCCESVAILDQQSIKKRNFWKNIGIEIGLLFQIVDDLIDHKGDATVVGKPTKRDKKKGKATLISFLGYKDSLNFAINLKKEIDFKIKQHGGKNNHLLDSVEFILKRNF